MGVLRSSGTDFAEVVREGAIETGLRIWARHTDGAKMAHVEHRCALSACHVLCKRSRAVIQGHVPSAEFGEFRACDNVFVVQGRLLQRV